MSLATSIAVNMPHIQVTGPMVLQMSGCRITVTPTELGADAPADFQRASAKPGESTPKDWQVAEAEIQRKTNMPFEQTTPVRSERLSLAPRPGATYRATTGVDVEIAKVVGRDGAVWVILDVHDRPVVLRRVDLNWHARPRDPTAPEPGDLILHHGKLSSVVNVLGEAEIGGWGVTDNRNETFHVMRGEGRRWMALGLVEPETQN